ncbi:MAG: winged helix DNA-binding protein, partial [Anaerolineales bacterium]|nr:winged helix DNA-binding protein [Anaerolineales bacterium]
MAKGQLTDRQRRILDYILSFTTDNGYPPSIRQIGASVGISSTSVVNYNLNRLVEEGYLDRDKKVSRGIRLTDKLLKATGKLGDVIRIP